MSVTPPPISPTTAPPFVQGAEAEQDQYGHARMGFAVALSGQPVGNRRLSGRAVPTGTLGPAPDVRSPQIFTSHPAIRYAVQDTPTGYVSAMPHLPGRMGPAGWDGESGSMAPTETQAV